MRTRPLSGIRVLDLTVIWAGPSAVTMLGDLGAEIVRVESTQHHIVNTRGFLPWPKLEDVPQLGNTAKLYVDMDPGERPWNRFAIFNSLGRNKLSMTVDMTKEDGRAVVHELVRVCDVLIENNRMGMLDSFGLDYETVHGLNPTLVYVTMPLFGLSGPYRDYIGFGTQGEAMAGFYALRGYEGESPMSAGGSNHMDGASGIAAALATLMALYQRDSAGKGQLVEVSQVEHIIQHLGGPLMDALMNGRDQAPIGNRDAVRAPQGIYPCQGEDRWVAVSVGDDAEWEGLCAAIGRPGIAKDSAYRGNAARRARHDEIDIWIAEWTVRQDARRAMDLLQEHGVPAGLVADDGDPRDDPQLQARGFFHRMDHPDCGTHSYPGHTFHLSKTPLRFDTPPPTLGQHNDYVYRELLGKEAGEIDRLTDEGHIGDGYADRLR